MNEMTVGTRELKNKLSEYLRRVKAGQPVPLATFDRGLWAAGQKAGMDVWPQGLVS